MDFGSQWLKHFHCMAVLYDIDSVYGRGMCIRGMVTVTYYIISGTLHFEDPITATALASSIHVDLQNSLEIMNLDGLGIMVLGW